MRIFGIYINVRENNATEKLITKPRNMKVIKLICVNNKNSLSLTLGKEYYAYVITAGNTYYRLFNDKGKINSYTTDLFMTLEEYRNKRLEELGIWEWCVLKMNMNII